MSFLKKLMGKNGKGSDKNGEESGGFHSPSHNGHREDGENMASAGSSPRGSPRTDQRKKHRYSVSHSGRYKNKKRERSQILNREELWATTGSPELSRPSSQGAPSYGRTVGANTPTSGGYRATANYGAQPSYNYRDVKPQLANVNRIMPRSPPTAAV